MACPPSTTVGCTMGSNQLSTDKCLHLKNIFFQFKYGLFFVLWIPDPEQFLCKIWGDERMKNPEKLYSTQTFHTKLGQRMPPQKRLYPTVVRHKTFQFGPRKIKTCEISIFSFPALDKSECIAQYLHDPVGIHKAFKMIAR